MNSRTTILEQIRKAHKTPSDLPDTPDGIEQNIALALHDITPANYQELRDQFKKELETVSGECMVCHSKNEITEQINSVLKENNFTSIAVPGSQLPNEIAQMIKAQTSDIEIKDASKLDSEKIQTIAKTPAGLVDVSYAVADISSLAVIFDDTPSSLPHFLPDFIFAVLTPDQITANLFELFEKIPKEKAKNMVLVTGPSRTADIEKILILGAHGPRRLIVYILEEK